MRGPVLACGRIAGALPFEGVEVEHLPERPGRAEVDPLLGPELLVVAGTDADLAAVTLRLLRKELLGATEVGFVPTDPGSAVARRWALPTDPRTALDLALNGAARPVPLVRDDAGGVLVGRGELAPVRGVVYCDEHLALRGEARSIVVEPDRGDGPGLEVTVTRGRLLRRRERFRCRAVQFGCRPVTPESDGVPYPRAMERWTWYRHTEDVLLIRPA
ncbi:hypothetical protein B0I33_10569 [Prauserella shujinwangii]|uniref:Uncharacterized protein n=1 Tax=Prauserella shujinwangii TaxID=1453103 RepID=A0A2T0LUH0_9PSEU|nr:hypothetical protein [Prauserella shujinwangii]PRX47491.1 hypothetical protein B0I33_10569 [Prauserella shujinwangii]